MRRLVWIWLIMAAVATAASPRAEAETLSVTVGYRERIALPPEAEVEVRLLDLSRGGAAATLVTAQRFAMTGVPTTVSLTYDPMVTPGSGRYALTATIWAGDAAMFGLATPQTLADGPGAGPVDLVLAMVAETDGSAVPVAPVTGITWQVTEVLGVAWGEGDPATLELDAELRFSATGGCNRYNGQAAMTGTALSFPADFAGTLMACPEAVETRERQFLDALRRTAQAVRYGVGLVLTDASGTALMHLVPAP
jgi:putative lipoprotein